MPAFKILAPLDESSRDRIVRPHLIRMAGVTGATIYLLHVVPTVRSLIPHAASSAESYISGFEQDLRARGIDVHGIVRKGDPAAEIATVASEYEVDAIVMGTRGRRGFDRLVLGSVTEAVMSRCAYPILLVNEATARTLLDVKIQTQSSYMAGVVWNKVARGLLSDEQAVAEMQRLSAQGLDHDVLAETYATLSQSGGPAEWLDIEFQVATLQEFMPSEGQSDTAAA